MILEMVFSYDLVTIEKTRSEDVRVNKNANFSSLKVKNLFCNINQSYSNGNCQTNV